MWVKKALTFNNAGKSSSAVIPPSAAKKSLSFDIKRDGNNSYESVEAKRRHKGGCFLFKEVSIEPETASSLKDVDSSRLKAEIKRWARAVVAYAQQVSGKFSVSKSSSNSRRHNSSNSFGDVGG